MKKITREQAEKLLLDSNVLNTTVKQNKNELRIFMNLSGNKDCLIKYEVKSQKKSYFLVDSIHQIL